MSLLFDFKIKNITLVIYLFWNNVISYAFNNFGMTLDKFTNISLMV